MRFIDADPTLAALPDGVPGPILSALRAAAAAPPRLHRLRIWSSNDAGDPGRVVQGRIEGVLVRDRVDFAAIAERPFHHGLARQILLRRAVIPNRVMSLAQHVFDDAGQAAVPMSELLLQEAIASFLRLSHKAQQAGDARRGWLCNDPRFDALTRLTLLESRLPPLTLFDAPLLGMDLSTQTAAYGDRFADSIEWPGLLLHEYGPGKRAFEHVRVDLPGGRSVRLPVHTHAIESVAAFLPVDTCIGQTLEA